MYYNYSFFFKVISILGISSFVCYLIAHFARLKIVSVYIRPLNRRVLCRPHTADFVTLRTIFVKKEYQFNFSTPPKYIIDCGANVGYSTLAFALFYPSAKVIALEPEKQNFSILMQNIKGVNNIIPLQKAVWPYSTQLFLVNEAVLSHSFQYQEQANMNPTAVTDAISISDLITAYNIEIVDLLKIDIEGAEKELFMATDLHWLAKVKMIAVEIHGADIKTIIFEVLAKHGFTRKKLGEKHLFINQKCQADF
jgi:FkbM family methyltransferase